MPTLTSIPEPGNIGHLEETTFPHDGFIGPHKIGDNIWIVRRLFSLGAGQRQGLSYEGLRGRLLTLLGKSPLEHPALNNSSTCANESTCDQLAEEREKIEDICAGEFTPFPLDSTMTITRNKAGQLTLHSVVPCDPALLRKVEILGQVSLLLVPNLQHWLFLQEWLQHFPQADVGLVESACKEDLLQKMEFLKHHAGSVFYLRKGDEPQIVKQGLTGVKLEGAPLALNEFLFYHKESKTLLASDSFYGGYTDDEVPSWFARLWFKLNKYGSFRAARLPIYRTTRVLTHGDETVLLKCVRDMLAAWDIGQITFSHGTSPFNAERVKGSGHSVGDMYMECWRTGLAAAKALV